MKNLKYIFLFTLLSIVAFGQKSDSLRIVENESRISILEGSNTNAKEALSNQFETLKRDLKDEHKDEHKMLKWLAFVGGPVSIVTLLALFGGAKKYVREKINAKFDKIITEKEGDILALIDHQSQEKQFVKNKKILVLTPTEGDDTFLRKFFKQMEFPINNVDYIKISNNQKEFSISKDDDKKILDSDLIFANNEDGKLAKGVIDEYFNHSKDSTVLFYFNTTRVHYNNSKVENRLSFANTKTQIYGNLINLFKFQKTL